ncbi:alpha/beta hydrolase family protein [Motilimonas sp. KMU-193]|uniref:alpha/beta hydrolase family protein n=1 Tax=Motilimonas sp. KMU-193 TaxID=3388668 RepID=UPI00396B331E
MIGAQSQSDEYAKRLSITSPFHMNSSTAPTLLVQGQSDRIVPTSQATNYMEKLQADNAAVKLLLQPADHFSMLNVDSFQWQQTVEAIELMMNF